MGEQASVQQGPRDLARDLGAKMAENGWRADADADAPFEDPAELAARVPR